ncbi:MAG: hypothetical protein J6Y29_00445 [Clostridiales bacterium]|nr:hypothetical protein [Clostridiales bacterium]
MPFFRCKVHATSPYTEGTLGICTIANPEYRSNGDDTSTDASIYNRVYFGYIPNNPTGRAVNNTCDGNNSSTDHISVVNPYKASNNTIVQNVPIYWRVLNTTANDINKTKALFMLMEYGLPQDISWDMRYFLNTTNPGGQRWTRFDENGNAISTDSSLRKFLQGSSCTLPLTNNVINGTAIDPCGNSGTSFYDECFGIAEQNVILWTINNERDNWSINSYPYNNNNICAIAKPAAYGPNDADRPLGYIDLDNNNFRVAGDTSTNIVKNPSSNLAYIYCGCSLNREKIFLLSVKESLDTNYGFSNIYDYYDTWDCGYRTRRDTNRICRKFCETRQDNNRWWLRSAFSYITSSMGFINQRGLCTDNDSNVNFSCVRCALNVPLSSILMVSDASSTGISPSTNSPIATFTPMPGTSLSNTNPAYLVRTKFQYSTTDSGITISSHDGSNAVVSISGLADHAKGAKLTIVDDTMTFDIEDKNTRHIESSGNRNLTISYKNAKAKTSVDNGQAGYISAIIKNNTSLNESSICEAKPLYYARLIQNDSGGNGSVTMKIPDELPDGLYTLIVYNEIERGTYRTNYANYVPLIISISDTTVPAVNNIYRNSANTTFKFTEIDDINLGQVVTSSGDTKLLSGSNITTNILTNQPQTSINVYDALGNLTTKTINDMTLDSRPPIVLNITYKGNGIYNITANDTESGIWKITSGDGSRTYCDYSNT